MATYIKTLKEDNGDITYPQTKASAVLLTNNSDLETELTKYVTAEDIATTSALTPPVQTNMIADGAVTTAKLAAGIVTTTRTVLFTNDAGTAANVTVSQALNNFDEVEFWFIDPNTTPNQLIRTIPGDALAVVLDIPHPGGSNTIYWNLARWSWTAGATTLTQSSNHYQKVISTSVSNQTANYIKIRKIVGIKFVSNT